MASEMRLPNRIVLLYAFPAFGVNLAGWLFGFYHFKFSTDVLYVAPGVLGLLVGLSRVWDAVSDPLAGYYSDRTHGSMGRRRPWMLVGGVALAASVFLLWAPPEGLQGAWITVWVGVSLLAYTTASTAFGVPYAALGAELTTDHHDRTRLFAYQQVLGGVGSALALVAFYLFLEAETPDESWLGLGSRAVALYVAIFCAGIALASIFSLVGSIRERLDYRTRGPEQIFGAYRDVFTNRHALILLFVFIVQTFGTASMGLLAAYLFQYILKAPNWMAAATIGSLVISMAISIPFWVRASRRFGKVRTYRITLWMLGPLYGLLYFALDAWDFEGHPEIVLIGCLYTGVVGALNACGYILAPSIQVDIIDVDEYRTGERKEGSYLATWSFVQKSAGGLAAILLGAALEFVGYTPGQEQTEAARLAIVTLISIVPGIAYLLAAFVFRRFDLDEAEHTRIRAVLDERAAESQPIVV